MEKVIANSNKGKIYIGELVPELCSKEIYNIINKSNKIIESFNCLKGNKVLHYGFFYISEKKYIVLPYELWSNKNIDQTYKDKIIYCNYLEASERNGDLYFEIPRNGKLVYDVLYIQEPEKNIEIFKRKRGRRKMEDPNKIIFA